MPRGVCKGPQPSSLRRAGAGARPTLRLGRGQGAACPRSLSCSGLFSVSPAWVHVDAHNVLGGDTQQGKGVRSLDRLRVGVWAPREGTANPYAPFKFHSMALSLSPLHCHWDTSAAAPPPLCVSGFSSPVEYLSTSLNLATYCKYLGRGEGDPERELVNHFSLLNSLMNQDNAS